MHKNAIRACLLSVTVLACVVLQALAQGEETQTAVALSIEPLHEQIRVGEPLFLRVVLTNRSDKPLTLRKVTDHRHLRDQDWQLLVSADNEPFEAVKLRGIRDSVIYRKGFEPKGKTLPPGGQVSDWLMVWFALGTDEEARELVFREPGAYRVRIILPVAGRAVGEATVRVSGKGPGFDRMMQALRGIMFDDAMIPYRYVGKVDALLEDLGDSPYARFIKWQRIRSYLIDGADSSGHNALEGANAAKEAAVFSVLSQQLIAESPDEESPLMRDAWAMKGILSVVEEKPDEARKIYERLKRVYGHSGELNRLKSWAY